MVRGCAGFTGFNFWGGVTSAHRHTRPLRVTSCPVKPRRRSKSLGGRLVGVRSRAQTRVQATRI
eukprot:5212864-Prymnesium_polylepis.1